MRKHERATKRGGALKRLADFLPESVKEQLRPYVSELYMELDGSYRAAVAGRIANVDDIIERLKNEYQPVKCPLILISQIQRSGGSLLSQLFDGHSELLAHPQELKLGYPSKDMWPPLKPENSIDKQFKLLFERSVIEMSRLGYAKGKQDRVRKNFFFLPKIQREIYRAAMGKVEEPASSRDMLDAYFTSYFNAWLNMRASLTQGRFITGFAPMLAARTENTDKFWEAYPDGYLISILRSPFTWFASAKRLGDGGKFGDIEKAVSRWNSSTQAMIREKQARPDRVIVLRFSDLLSNLEAAMRHVSERVGIEFEQSLLTPSFNSEPMGANTSFEKVERGTVSSAPLEREKHLSKTEKDFLEKHCREDYERALSDAVESV